MSVLPGPTCSCGPTGAGVAWSMAWMKVGNVVADPAHVKVSPDEKEQALKPRSACRIGWMLRYPTYAVMLPRASAVEAPKLKVRSFDSPSTTLSSGTLKKRGL